MLSNPAQQEREKERAQYLSANPSVDADDIPLSLITGAESALPGEARSTLHIAKRAFEPLLLRATLKTWGFTRFHEEGCAGILSIVWAAKDWPVAHIRCDIELGFEREHWSDEVPYLTVDGPERWYHYYPKSRVVGLAPGWNAECYPSLDGLISGEDI